MAGALLAFLGSSGTSGFTVTVNRDILFGFGYTPGSAQTRNSVTCYPSGGTPPYTYLWTEVGGPSGISITSRFSPTTYFSFYSPTDDNRSGVFKCTVTDALANTADSPPVSVDLTVTSLS